MLSRRYGERTESWAARLVADPLIGPEPDATIADLTGCPLDDVAAARLWHDERMPPVRTLAAQLAARLDLPWTDPDDILRAALTALEYDCAEAWRPVRARRPRG